MFEATTKEKLHDFLFNYYYIMGLAKEVMRYDFAIKYGIIMEDDGFDTVEIRTGSWPAIIATGTGYDGYDYETHTTELPVSVLLDQSKIDQMKAQYDAISDKRKREQQKREREYFKSNAERALREYERCKSELEKLEELK